MYHIYICMFIDIGYGGAGEIRERSKDVLIGQLFVETALLTVKQNNDLLHMTSYNKYYHT